MNKLKTLKDLNLKINSNTEWIDYSEDVMKPKEDIVCISLLRKEAITWIKGLEDFRKIESIEFGAGDGKCEWRINGKKCNDLNLIDKYTLLSSYNPNEVMKWIKYFFNIKKEDLK